MIQLLNQLSQRPVYRSAQVDFFFTGWFYIGAVVMLYVLIKRLTLDDPAGYGDLVVFMVILYGFMLPGALYLLYAVVVFGMSWAQKSDPTAARVETFTPRWAVRSSISFGCALLVNALYVFG